MSPLIEKQVQFTRMVARLLLFAESLGYRVTLGEAYRLPDAEHGHPNSLHKQRLAIDLNLFDSEGHYLRDTDDHAELGAYWESMGGSWGGNFDDGNHYSLAHDGMK